jgi:uncharacterized protein YqgC (DUF456 family)
MPAVLLYLLLLLCLLAGLALLVVNMPGLWLMVLAAGAYAVLSKPPLTVHRLKVVLILAGMALVAEVIDFFAAGAGAKRAGGTRRGLWGAIIGGIAGAILGSFVLPVVLTLVGVCIGTFLGAFIGEVSGGKEFVQSARIGAHATAGRLAGTLMKMVFGCVMLVITMWWGWPWGKSAASGAAPASGTIIVAPTTTASVPLSWYSGRGLGVRVI